VRRTGGGLQKLCGTWQEAGHNEKFDGVCLFLLQMIQRFLGTREAFRELERRAIFLCGGLFVPLLLERCAQQVVRLEGRGFFDFGI
jgi:hypothetical protein